MVEDFGLFDDCLFYFVEGVDVSDFLVYSFFVSEFYVEKGEVVVSYVYVWFWFVVCFCVGIFFKIEECKIFGIF